MYKRMNSVWIAILLVLIISIMVTAQDQSKVSNVYVSQHKGSDTPSCGTDTHPCKTIVMEVWLAKQHASVYVDGTGSVTTPFTCRSSAIEIPGIHSNKSLSIIGIHSMVHVKCQEGSDVKFIKSILETKTTASVRNIKFINTTLQGRDISLDINDCTFTQGTQAVNLIQSTRPITMSFNNSLCVNTTSCITVNVTGRVLPTNQISINVTNSNVVASGLNTMNQVPKPAAILVTSRLDNTGGPGWITCDISFRNVTLQNNTFDSFGMVIVELKNVFSSLYLENVFVYNNTLSVGRFAGSGAMIRCAGIDVAYMHNHSMILKNVTFLQNKCDYCLPIYISTIDDISLNIMDSRFQDNYGIMTLFSQQHDIDLHIENTFFVGNLGSTGFMDREQHLTEEFFIYIQSSKTTSVSLKDSIFIDNFCKHCSLGMISLRFNVYNVVNITNCHFEYNVASVAYPDPPSFSMLCITSADAYFTLTNTTIIGDPTTESNGPVYLNVDNSVTVLLFNVTIEDNLFVGYDGALSLSLPRGIIKIDSCNFIGNKSPVVAGGGIGFQFLNGDFLNKPGCICKPSRTSTKETHFNEVNKPLRRWTDNVSVEITNTLFVNNSAVNGGALALSGGGSFTIRNCTFIDNFAHVQGGHIYSIDNSTRLEILDSMFLQKHSQMTVRNNNKISQTTGLFIYSENIGSLMIYNTTMESMWSRDVNTKPLIYISKGGLIDFGDNNKTVVKCPNGSSLDILNYRTVVGLKVITLLQFSCKACPIDTYSLQHGHSLGMTKVSGFECLPCPFGAVCHNKISAKPNYWGYKVNENPSELNFTQCPLGYCNMTDAYDFMDYNRCLGNRHGTLCGHCKENYSETLLSPSCCHDDKCKETWLWGVAVAMVMLMALYLIHKPRLSRMLKKQILWFRYSADRSDEAEDDRDNGNGGYLKIVFYFYQIVNIVLVTTSYNKTIKLYLLQPVIGLFNFQFRLSSSGLLCPFRGLTAVTKQLLFASQVFGVVVMIVVCYCCHRVLRMSRSRPPPNLASYVGAIVETLLLGFAVFANTSLQLLRCTSLASDWRLFIDGTVPCYQWWQYALMVFVGTAVVPFILTLALSSHWLLKGSISVKEFFIGCVLPLPYLMYKLISLLCGPHEANQEPPEWREAVTKVLYGPFRAPNGDSFGAVYWESILIFRRLILIVIYVFVQDPLSKELLLTFVSVVILCHHIIIQPFRDAAANIVEMISLFCLFTLSSINTFKASFVSFGEVQKGPLTTFEHIVDWIQIIILMALPVLLLLAVLAAIVSQFIRLIFKVLPYITHACLRSRGVHVIDDMDRDFVVPCGDDD